MPWLYGAIGTGALSVLMISLFWAKETKLIIDKTKIKTFIFMEFWIEMSCKNMNFN